MKRMHLASGSLLLAALTVTGCSRSSSEPQPSNKPSVEARLEALSDPATPVDPPAARDFVGFDRNVYPGEQRMIDLRPHFSFVGYWLNAPPGAKENTWAGKRQAIAHMGYGFLVLANGRLEAEIRKARTGSGQVAGLTPEALGRKDALDAIAAAAREGFPDGTILFLDQEEGGRLLPDQAAYFFAWTEAVAESKFRAGAYLSGQPSDDGSGPGGKRLTITTALDVREQIKVRHLHPVVFFVAQDSCPPAPGCTLQPPPVKQSGTLEAPVWQYAQSPRRAEQTRACGRTYAKDGSCYAGVSTDLPIDLDVADSADPSHGR